MFELSVACKYLIPRWRQLSVSIISIISMLVIALVVWLIVVFFSVKDGLEKSWIEKLIALTAPIRITPTEKYYQSYYYLIDSISTDSDYTSKTIHEKLSVTRTNPYSAEVDEEPPSYWPSPDTSTDGELKDIVGLAFKTAQELPGVQHVNLSDFEMTAANLRLRMIRPSQQEEATNFRNFTEQFIEQAAYIGSYDVNDPSAIAKTLIPFSLADIHNILISHSKTAEGILIPRNFKESGILAGDEGFLSYYSPTPSTIQEQRIPIYVAGFYDPGIIPIGGKFILASRELTGAIRASHHQEETPMSNGINMRFNNLKDAAKIKKDLIHAFAKKGIEPYWDVKTYQEYEFTKDLIQQLHSEKNLFSIISIVIIIVACSNIISMLIILVNDKKIEIGILRSMGATSQSIAIIFGLCGMVMGAIGSIIGIVAAIATLHQLDFLVGVLGKIQGHALFNPVFYGTILPNEISWEVLGYVVLTTALISLLAGIVPAVKASLLRPSAILRSE